MGLLWAFLIFGTVVFIHEFGHFIVAKMVKSPVYKFSIGMGPNLISKKIGETEYAIGWLPLGGYVQFDANEDGVFLNLHPLKKIAIFFAGPLFNFILAFIIIVGIFFNSGYPSTTLGEISPDSPASVSGLKVGDTILSINNKDISSWNDILNSVISNTSKELVIKIDRDNEIKTINVKTELSEDGVNYKIGIAPEYKKDLFKSISSGFSTTIENIKATFESLIEAFKGFIPLDKDNTNDTTEQEPAPELTGPIGMISTMATVSSDGFSSIVMLVISISISLGAANLLPIPIFDGGRILLAFVELIRGGKRLNEKHELYINLLGIVIVLALLLFTTWNDISNLFQ